jgi:hypothetical protein
LEFLLIKKINIILLLIPLLKMILYFSLATIYVNQKKEYQKSVNFLKFGQKYDPNYLDFALDLIYYDQQLKDSKLAAFPKNVHRNKVTLRNDVLSSKKMNF